MKILSHRGLWKTASEQNSVAAFARSIKSGFGIETDVRDSGGSLVISHDVPNSKLTTPFIELLHLVASMKSNAPLAINIKSDGLHHLLNSALRECNVSEYFLFDMSIPDTIQAIKSKLNVFVRQSDIEPHVYLYSDAGGIWMDAFDDDTWIKAETIEYHLQNGKSVCVVSPELHGRTHMPLWLRIRQPSIAGNPQMMLCTDFPLQADKFFNYVS